MPAAAPSHLVQPAYSATAQAAIARAPALFIDGGWAASSSGGTIAVEDPSTGRVIAHVVDASDADVDRAVAAARAAFDDGRWSGLAPARRERVMHRLADLIEARADDFAELEAIDNGKPRASAATIDVPAAVDALRYMAGWASKLGGETPEPYSLPPGQFLGYTLRQPVGVCAQIVPWNFPLLMAVQKMAPALAAGCTLVLKPAEQTPLTALRLADLVAEAGFPAGVVNIVTGRGETAGAALVRHPGVDKVAFTGSTEVGKAIGRSAIDTVKRVTLELGGKSPVIIFPDADLPGAARGASNAIFYNSGQVCVAGSRLFAHRSVFDEVLERVTASTRAWLPRPSLDPRARAGPLVSQEQLDRVTGYIAAGRRDGASIAAGGDSPASDGGYYLNPTVLVDVTARMRVAREEIFGPVLVAQRFDDLDEAAAAANDTAYGLGASVWTRDIAMLHGMAARIRAGLVWGNTHGAIDTAFPFGGFKQSGSGREQGRQGIEAYLETKTVIVKI